MQAGQSQLDLFLHSLDLLLSVSCLHLFYQPFPFLELVIMSLCRFGEAHLVRKVGHIQESFLVRRVCYAALAHAFVAREELLQVWLLAVDALELLKDIF